MVAASASLHSVRRRVSVLLSAPSARLAWWISFAVLSFLGGLWAVSSPLMSGPDEGAHTIKAVAVARGELRGRDVRVVGDGPTNQSRRDTHVIIPRAYADLRACFMFVPTIPAGCAPAVGTDTTPTEATTYTGSYPPLYYALTGWPSRLLSPYRALYAMRFCSVAVCSALLASALVSARRLAPDGAGVAAVALGLTPLVVFLMGTINPSAFEIAAAMATWASLLDLLRRRGPAPARLVLRVVVATICFAAVRPLSPVFAMLVVAAVLAMAATPARLRELAGDRRARLGGLAIVIGLAASTLWVVASKAYDSFAGTPQPGVSLGTAVRGVIDLEPWHTRQMYGVFGWLDTPTPWGMVMPWLITCGLVLVVALALGSWRERAVLTGWLAVTVAFPVVAEALRVEKYGYIWQGRYTMPLAVGLPILSAWVISRSNRVPRPAVRDVALVIIIGMAIGQLLAHGIALTRYIVAVPGTQAFGYLSGTGWRPPLSAPLLFVLSIIGCGGYAVWLAVLTRDRRTTP